MKKIIKNSLTIALTVGATTILMGCQPTPPQKQEKPLNISIYLDLSDRLLKGGEPDQKEKDLAIVDTIAGLFRDATIGPKILKSENRLKVLFYPAPQDAKINALADSLSIDIGSLKNKDKIVEVNGLKARLHNNISEIYDLTLAQQNWIGSDIWGFFSDPTKIDAQCIDKGARNVIIILTDGFLFHVNSKKKVGDAYSYVLKQTLTEPNSSLIVERDDLDNIEVLMLEIAPTGENLNLDQKTKMRKVLTDWLTEMGVQHFQIVEADLPSNTAQLIKKFLEEEVGTDINEQ